MFMPLSVFRLMRVKSGLTVFTLPPVTSNGPVFEVKLVVSLEWLFEKSLDWIDS